MTSENFYMSAMSYLEKGFSVIPTDIKTKLPIVNWIDYQRVKPEKDQVHKWSESYESNIAVVTGNVSGITVVDVDSDEGFKALSKLNIDTDTYTVLTGKGRHLYYKYTPEVATIVGLIDGIDIRNDGGYVIAPPSVHISGRQYQLASDKHFKPFPEELLKVYNEVYKNKAKGKRKEASSALLLAEKLKDGSRNSLLTSVAGSLKNLGLSKEAAMQALLYENTSSASPLRESEVERIIDSVWRYPGTEKMFPLTDVGNKERMENLYSNSIIYNSDIGKWLHYDGTRWRLDIGDSVIQDMTITMVRRIPQEVEHLDPEDEVSEAYLKWSKNSESARKIRDCISLTSKSFGLPNERFDKDPFRFNMKNGTLDLQTGKFSRHNRFDYMTKLSPVEYHEMADCPRWMQFLDEVFQGNKEVINFIQKAVGYSLSASTNEQAFFLMYGTGANGKSVFIDTINYIMGDYSKRAEFSTFISRRTSGSPRNDIAMLNGARMVSASEGSTTAVFDEALIKQLTGDETITARFLYQENFEFTPTFKIWLATNHLPIIKDDSFGIWRRLKCIPFTVKFEKNQQDPYLLKKLKAEAPGIVLWALAGFMKWKKEGLGECSAIDDATERYKEDMDIFGNFEESVVEKVLGARLGSKELYEAYSSWMKDNGHNPLSQNRFGIKLRERGYEKIKSGGVMYWLGVTLKNSISEF